jgi:hypothetical protein
VTAQPDVDTTAAWVVTIHALIRSVHAAPHAPDPDTAIADLENEHGWRDLVNADPQPLVGGWLVTCLWAEEFDVYVETTAGQDPCDVAMADIDIDDLNGTLESIEVVDAFQVRRYRPIVNVLVRDGLI